MAEQPNKRMKLAGRGGGGTKAHLSAAAAAHYGRGGR